MAAQNIAAAAVTNKTIHAFELPTEKGSLKKSGTESWRLVLGTITITVASAGDALTYTTAAQIPVDNLFDSTKASYIELVASTCRTVFLSRIAGGIFENALVADWTNKKIKVLALPATPAENEDLDELANATALGANDANLTIEFAVIGRVVRT